MYKQKSTTQTYNVIIPMLGGEQSEAMQVLHTVITPRSIRNEEYNRLFSLIVDYYNG